MKAAKMHIRSERPGDEGAIRALISAAFARDGQAGTAEAAIVDGLRAAGALSLSLVATAEGEGVVGHVAFSPVTIAGEAGRWFGLGPLGVCPDRQRSGIGAALVRAGLARLAARGASGCVLLGDPVYYGRLGFRADARLVLPGFPAAYFQCCALDGRAVPEGTVAYHAAFGIG